MLIFTADCKGTIPGNCSCSLTSVEKHIPLTVFLAQFHSAEFSKREQVLRDNTSQTFGCPGVTGSVAGFSCSHLLESKTRALWVRENRSKSNNWYGVFRMGRVAEAIEMHSSVTAHLWSQMCLKTWVTNTILLSGEYFIFHLSNARVKMRGSCCSFSQVQAVPLLTELLGPHQALCGGLGGSEHFNWVFLQMRNRQVNLYAQWHRLKLTQSWLNVCNSS